MRKYIILAMQKVLRGWFIVMFLLIACTEDDGKTSNDKLITFSSHLSGIASRTDSQDFINTKERWLVDDAIGVFYINSKVLSEESIINGVRNSKYVSTRPGENTIFTSDGDKHYYSYNNGTPTNFLAYYPYTTDLLTINESFVYPINVKDQGDISKIDLLYAVASGDQSLDDAIVPLTFKHQLSKLVLNISGESYENMKVKATGFYTKAIFSLANQFITERTGELDVIDVKLHNRLRIEMLVIPQSVSNGSMSFNLEGNVATWNIINKEFEAGKKYEYSLRLDLPRVEVSGESISEWEEGGQYPIDKEKSDIKIDIINNLLVKIPGNTYLIGSLPGVGLPNEWPQHKAGIGTFWITPYEITNEQYALFLNAYENGIKDQPIIVDGHELLSDTVGTVGVWFDSSNNTWYSKEGRESYPITNVTWYGARAFAFWLGGDLPTESEWEAACRVEDLEGKSVFSFDDSKNDVLDYVNCKEKANSGTMLVKSLKSTKYGLYHMHGNVSEWCFDAVERSGSGSPASYAEGNIILEQNDKTLHVIRGGSWRSPLEKCRSAFRECLLPTQALDDVGFRVVFPIKDILNVDVENLKSVMPLVK
jgi:formylglycine-generating enzyme required for sulfatase activity